MFKYINKHGDSDNGYNKVKDIKKIAWKHFMLGTQSCVYDRKQQKHTMKKGQIQMKIIDKLERKNYFFLFLRNSLSVHTKLISLQST